MDFSTKLIYQFTFQNIELLYKNNLDIKPNGDLKRKKNRQKHYYWLLTITAERATKNFYKGILILE